MINVVLISFVLSLGGTSNSCQAQPLDDSVAHCSKEGAYSVCDGNCHIHNYRILTDPIILCVADSFCKPTPRWSIYVCGPGY